MEDNDELSQLEELLCADLEESVESKTVTQKSVSEINIFEPSTSSVNDDLVTSCDKSSLVHNGDTDSSDDEEKRNYLDRKYSDYGSGIKKTLDNQELEHKHRTIDFESRLRQANLDVKISRTNSFKSKPHIASERGTNFLCAPDTKTKSNDVYADPVFGLRIVKPLISSAALLDRMQGREPVSMMRIKRYVENEDLSKDWVIAGVIVRKSSSKQSKKGNQFLIWTLSDLKDDLKTVSMFLFSKAYSDLWKTTEGTVVAVLNPNVLDRTENSIDQACLSVEKPDRVMILGQSKDLGTCKSKKKNGEPCTAFVNLSQCETCIYHVKQEYQKFSRRQELQSSTMGKGLVNLRNKVLGKDTVIYGGKSYSALPKGDTKKVREKDQNRLMSLSDYYKTEGDKLMTNKAPYGSGSLKNNSCILHSPTVQKPTDIERLNSLTGLRNSNKHNLGEPNIKSILDPSEQSLADKVASSPKLGKGFSLKGTGVVDLNMSYSEKVANMAKMNAIRLIQQNGGIQRKDPNNIKGTESGKKRALESLNKTVNENDPKRLKTNEEVKSSKTIMSDRFKKILEATSAHQNLIEQHDDDEQEKYFNKLEKKESMEEKMLNTFKLPCKAVRCAKCKYTAFSAAQRCKDERHPLKVLDTYKRFFKCGNCSNRTVSLEIIPLHSCSNCKSSKWEKAPMMREKKLTTLSDGLSIRGEEESHIGGQVTAGKNLNLLVPDDS